MDFFKNGFLKTLPDTLFDMTGYAFNHIALYAILMVVAFEVSRRLPKYGTTVAIAVFLALASYATFTTYLSST